MNDYGKETIAAISTPFGESGIGIVRISGPLAEAIAKRLFRPKLESSHLVSHHVHYGEIIDPRSRNLIDEVLIVLMKSPRTYTREDIVEIQCHGGYLVLEKILELALEAGARMALPGEFTKRAFLNGRIDLTQAEAVIDVIRAKTAAVLGIATQQLNGWLYREIGSFKERLILHLALIEVHIDFPEEEIEAISSVEIKQDLEGMIFQLGGWISSYGEGRIFREGISCAIVGKTNVGKSSLLNVLLKEERAIVTPIPGTTRDVIEEVLNISGIPVRLIDTAGLRRTSDSIEREGVKRAWDRAAECDLLLLMLDGGRAIDEDDLEIFKAVKKKRKIVVINKNDLPLVPAMEELRELFPDDPVVSISALKGEGVEKLKETIHLTSVKGEKGKSRTHEVIANVRHKVALGEAKECLLGAVKGLEEGISPEFVAFEIRSALKSFGEIVGETTPEEVLNRIFEQFCIGK